ncbi:MAG: hypothetical protein GY730_05455 [bacterium]|nr:hypothetical protein [bacterium]
MKLIRKNQLIKPILFLLLLTLFGCQNEEDLKTLNKIAIPSLEIQINVNRITEQFGSYYVQHPLDAIIPTVDKLEKTEQDFTQGLSENVLDIFEKKASIKILSAREFSSDQTFLRHTKEKPDKYIFMPKPFRKLNPSPEKIASICEVIGVDGLLTIRIEFFRNAFPQPFVGKVDEIKAECLLKLFGKNGNVLLEKKVVVKSNETISNSNKVPIRRRYNISVSNEYGKLYKQATKNLILALEKEIDMLNNIWAK